MNSSADESFRYLNFYSSDGGSDGGSGGGSGEGIYKIIRLKDKR